MAGNSLFKLITGIILFTVFSISAQTAVEKHGMLSAQHGTLLDKNGKVVQLRGMSFYWTRSDWPGAKYYTAGTVDALVDSWKCTVLRVAIDRDGGKNNAADWNTAKVVVDEAIKKGIYVILDWHAHDAEQYAQNAITFFTDQAKAYKSTPNVIFEPYNEPKMAGGATTGTQADAMKTWNAIKPYLTNVTKAIRDQGNNNLVIVGTPYFSQFVNVAAQDTIPYNNVAYAFHFYSASHGSGDLPYYAKEEGRAAMEASYLNDGLTTKKITVFITEWGTTHSDGGEDKSHSYIDETNTYWWFDNYVNKYHISHCNWSVSDFQLSSAFSGGATAPNLSTSTSGAIVKKLLTNQPTDTYEPDWLGGSDGPSGDSTFNFPGYHPAVGYNKYSGGIQSGSIGFSIRDQVDPQNAAAKCINILPGNEETWVKYNINVTSAVTGIKFRYRSDSSTGYVELYRDTVKLGNDKISIQKANAWTTVNFPTSIQTGKSTLKFKFTGTSGPGYKIEWIQLYDPSTVVSSLSKAGVCNAGISIVKNGLSLNFPAKHGYTSYVLIGITGQIVRRGAVGPGVSQIMFNDLSNGMWLLRIKEAGSIRLLKAIINN